METFRRWLATPGGKVVAVVVAVGALAVAVWAVSGFLAGDTPEDARARMFICSETGKTFRHDLVMGETLPVLSPYSGKNTGVPAEPCRWTADGGVKAEPTWVLVNEYAGRPGPTFCPDCGRLVVGHNPPARQGATPPPKQAEYKPRAGGGKAADSRDDR